MKQRETLWICRGFFMFKNYIMEQVKRFTMNNNWLFDSLSRSVYDIDFMYSWTYDKTFKRTYVNFKDGNTVDFSDCSTNGETVADLITFYLFK